MTLGPAIVLMTEVIEAGIVYFVADLFYQTGVKETVRPASQRPPVPRVARSRQPRLQLPHGSPWTIIQAILSF